MKSKQNNEKYEKIVFYFSLELVSVNILTNPAGCRCNFCQRIDSTQAYHAGDRWSHILSLHQQLRNITAIFDQKFQIFQNSRKNSNRSNVIYLHTKIFETSILAENHKSQRICAYLTYFLRKLLRSSYKGVIGNFWRFLNFDDFWLFSETPQNVLWKWHTHQMKRLA